MSPWMQAAESLGTEFSAKQALDRSAFVFSENGDNVLEFDDEKSVVAFEIDRDGSLGVEQDSVILFQREHGV